MTGKPTISFPFALLTTLLGIRRLPSLLKPPLLTALMSPPSAAPEPSSRPSASAAFSLSSLVSAPSTYVMTSSIETKF